MALSSQSTALNSLQTVLNSQPMSRQRAPTQQTSTVTPNQSTQISTTTPYGAKQMLPRSYGTSPVEISRTQLEHQIFNGMEICHHIDGKLKTLMNSNAYKTVCNFNDIKQLYIHLSYLFTYTIGRFRTLQEKCIEDMKQLGFTNDANSLLCGQVIDKYGSDCDEDEIEVVEPQHDTIDIADSDDEQNKSFEKRSVIQSNQATESWVQCGSYLDLCYSARTIVVKVDGSGLPPGVYTARIKAFDGIEPEKGTVFEIPVTVVQPTVLDTKSNWQIDFPVANCKPNTISRHFILVPNNASWAVLRLRSNDTVKSTLAKFLIHTMQILPQRYCKTLETEKFLPVFIENDTIHYFRVEPNNILEVCIAKYWSNFGDTSLKSSLEFQGVRVNGTDVMMHGVGGIHRIDLIALNKIDASPAIQLKTAVMVLKPSETKISPLTQRDVLPNGRQIYQHLLIYNLNLSKPQEVAFSLPLLCHVLYESEFESQFWMCFDANKKVVICAYSQNNFVKLNKGEYVIRLQVRHEKKDLLEKLNEAPLKATNKLSNPLSFDIYGSYKAALLSEKKMSCCTINAARTAAIYVAPLVNDKLTKAGYPSQCAWLQGTITLAKDESARKVDSSCFDYILPEGPAVPKKNNGASKSNSKEGKSKLEEYKEGIRDYQNGQISKLDLADAEEVYVNIIKDFPTYLTAHISLIQKLELAETKNSLPFTYRSALEKSNYADTNKATLQRIVDLANVVINETNTDVLLAYYGLKTDNRSDAAKIKIEMDKQKGTLINAHVRKIIALGKIGLIENHQNKKDIKLPYTLDDIDTIYTEIGKFIDYTDSKVAYLALWHAFLNQHYGRIIKILQKMYEEKPQREILEELLLVVKENKSDHVADLIQRNVIFANPSGYRLF